MVFTSQAHSLRIIRIPFDPSWQNNNELLHQADSNSKIRGVNTVGTRNKLLFLRKGGVIVKRDLDNNDKNARGNGGADSTETEAFNKHFKTLLEENQTKTLYNPKEEQQNKLNKNYEFKTNNRQQKFIDNYHVLLSNNSYLESKIHRNVVGFADKINELATDDEVNAKDSSHATLETHSDTSSNNNNSDNSRYNTKNLTGFLLNSSLDDKRKAISGSPSALSYIDTVHSNSSNSDRKKQSIPVTTVMAETNTNEPLQIMNDQPQEVNANRDDRILYTNTTGAEDDMVELITKNTSEYSQNLR